MAVIWTFKALVYKSHKTHVVHQSYSYCRFIHVMELAFALTQIYYTALKLPALPAIFSHGVATPMMQNKTTFLKWKGCCLPCVHLMQFIGKEINIQWNLLFIRYFYLEEEDFCHMSLYICLARILPMVAFQMVAFSCTFKNFNVCAIFSTGLQDPWGQQWHISLSIIPHCD